MIVKDSQGCNYAVVHLALQTYFRQFRFLCVDVGISNCSFKSFLQNEVTFLCRSEDDKKHYKIY